MGGTKQTRILTGSENINPAYRRQCQRQNLKSRKYILGVIEQYPNLYWLIVKPPIYKQAQIKTKVILDVVLT
jgi:hypothetical protein